MFDKSKTIDKNNADTILEINSYAFWFFFLYKHRFAIFLSILVES